MLKEHSTVSELKIFTMPINYVSDDTSATIAVQIPIEEWNNLKKKYPGMEELQDLLPQWQKKIIDSRLQAITGNPARLHAIEELFEELDKDED